MTATFKIFLTILGCVTLSAAIPPHINNHGPPRGGSESSSRGSNFNKGLEYAQGANAEHLNEDDSVKSSQASSFSSKKNKYAATNDNFATGNSQFAENEFGAQNGGYNNGGFNGYGGSQGYNNAFQGANQQGHNGYAQGAHSSVVSETEEVGGSQSSNYEANHHKDAGAMGQFNQGAEQLNQQDFQNQNAAFFD